MTHWHTTYSARFTFSTAWHRKTSSAFIYVTVSTFMTFIAQSTFVFFHQTKTGLTLECEGECLPELDEVDHLLMCGLY